MHHLLLIGNSFTLQAQVGGHLEIDARVELVADNEGGPDRDKLASLALLLHIKHHPGRLLQGRVMFRTVGQLENQRY